MTKRKAFFKSLPGELTNYLDGEVQIEMDLEITLPSGAVCTRPVKLRLGKLRSSKKHGYIVWTLIARDGQTELLASSKLSRWRSLQELISLQGGLDTMAKERALEVSTLYKKTLSWDLSLPL